ncbi:MAG: hypothetical protein CMJ54_00170 [Planctomycetaceae bacterium]|nr:hypothetical protein [Planctomycetaceae bacterium]
MAVEVCTGCSAQIKATTAPRINRRRFEPALIPRSASRRPPSRTTSRTSTAAVAWSTRLNTW